MTLSEIRASERIKFMARNYCENILRVFPNTPKNDAWAYALNQAINMEAYDASREQEIKGKQ